MPASANSVERNKNKKEDKAIREMQNICDPQSYCKLLSARSESIGKVFIRLLSQIPPFETF